MRRRVVWMIFAICLTVVLGAMGWISATALELARAEKEARRNAQLEENVRLTLWRMDSALAPLITQEIARPYFAYSAFYSADRSYPRMFAEPGGKADEWMVPSELLSFHSPYIHVHFQLSPESALSSPQVPAGDLREIAETTRVAAEAIDRAAGRLAELAPLLDREQLLEALPRRGAEDGLPSIAEAWVLRLTEQQKMQVAAYETVWLGNTGDVPGPEGQQQARNLVEANSRFLACEPTQLSQRMEAQGGRTPAPAPAVSGIDAPEPESPGDVVAVLGPAASGGTERVREGMIRPVWLGSILLLARRVDVAGRTYVQGCWVDWEATRDWLLSGVRDLLPKARLEPLRSENADSGERRLASLPLRLVPGSVPPREPSTASPILFSLGVSWICVILAACAVAVLLAIALALSERRRSFVSAVTHELRTPLTTFRMYTEMLAAGMVPSEEKRRIYLEKLCREADRLSHLVENVLAYARLESSRSTGHRERLTVERLLREMEGRLGERAQRDGMRLELTIAEGCASASVHVDTSSVEQILLNLVDNACKYAASAAEPTLDVEAERRGEELIVRVRDHGPGVSDELVGRLFRPFSKSVGQAARSAPGVGLGLSLSRRFARELDGDLLLESSSPDGTTFLLRLPLVASADGAA